MEKIAYSKPTIRRKEMASVIEALASDIIGPGEKRKKFETNFFELFDFSGSITSFRTVCDALKVALTLCEVKENSKVIISALSPFYYKEVIKSLNAEPIIVDVDKNNGLLSYEKASEHFDACDAIIFYEPFGNIPINDVWDDLDIPIIEDISESLLCEYEERKAGSIGTYIIHSLEAESLVSAGGGCVLISKKNERSLLNKSTPKEIALCDMNAALAVVQISKLKDNTQRRNEIFKEYVNSVSKGQHRVFGISSADYFNSGYGFCLLTKNKNDDIIKFAKKYKIEAKMPFKDRVITFNEETSDKYMNAKSLYFKTVAFPLYPYLRNNEKSEIIKILSHLP